MNREGGDLWLILALLGVFLLLSFCVWGMHFTPDMSQPPDAVTQTFGTSALCGGPFLLLFAGICFLRRV